MAARYEEPQKVTLARIVENNDPSLRPPIVINIWINRYEEQIQFVLDNYGTADRFGGNWLHVKETQQAIWRDRGGIVQRRDPGKTRATGSMKALQIAISAHFPVRYNGTVLYRGKDLCVSAAAGGAPPWAIQWIKTWDTTSTPFSRVAWTELTTPGGVDVMRETLKEWGCAPEFVIGTNLERTRTFTTGPLENKPQKWLKFNQFENHTKATVDHTKVARGLVVCSVGHQRHMLNCTITTKINKAQSEDEGEYEAAGDESDLVHTTIECIDYEQLNNHPLIYKKGERDQVYDICNLQLDRSIFHRRLEVTRDNVMWPQIVSESTDPAPCTAIALFRHIVLTHEDKTGEIWEEARALSSDAATLFIALLHRGAFEIKETRDPAGRVEKALYEDEGGSIAQILLCNLIGTKRQSALRAIGKHLEDLPMDQIMKELESPGVYVVETPLGGAGPGGCVAQAAFTDRAAHGRRGGV